MNDLIEVHHGRLKMELPRSWRDRSELAFESPVQKLAADPRRPGAVKEYNNNVHVTFEERAPNLGSPGDYLDLIAEKLRQQGVMFVEVQRFELSDDTVPRTGIERRVSTQGGWVRQFSAVSLYPDIAVVATASTIEPSQADTLKELRRVISSVRFD